MNGWWPLVALVVLVFAGSALAAILRHRHKSTRPESENHLSLVYRYTPRAAEYRLYWSKETLATIDARCKEIAKEENVYAIDVPIIKQAILEVAHNEWIKLSNRR